MQEAIGEVVHGFTWPARLRGGRIRQLFHYLVFALMYKTGLHGAELRQLQRQMEGKMAFGYPPLRPPTRFRFVQMLPDASLQVNS